MDGRHDRQTAGRVLRVSQSISQAGSTLGDSASDSVGSGNCYGDILALTGLLLVIQRYSKCRT